MTGRVANIWSLLCAAMIPAYMLVFSLDLGGPSTRRLLDSVVSAGSLWLLGLVSLAALRWLLSRTSAVLKMVGVPAFALAIAFAWYVAIVSLYAWISGGPGGGGVIFAFGGPAFRWQLLQGCLAGALLVAMVDAQLSRERADALADRLAFAHRGSDQGDSAKSASTLLVRDGDEFLRVDLADIVSIAADNDDSRIRAGMRSHVVRKSLKQLESQLPDNFLRIHRSTIVNLDKIERVEPAGAGRLTVHLSDGSSPVASKAGARSLRTRIV